MSLFDRQGIPEQLIHNRVEIESSNQIKQKNQQRIQSRGIQYLIHLFHRNRDCYESHEQDKKNNRYSNEFEDDLLILRNYVFISISEIQSAFEIHTLVQLVMRM